MIQDLSMRVKTVRRSRRPQWRGEREAILIRLPKQQAERLKAEAQRRGASVSDLAGGLILAGMNEEGWPA